MKIVWLEDDATPGTEGHEGLCAAYNRLFGQAFVSARHIAETGLKASTGGGVPGMTDTLDYARQAASDRGSLCWADGGTIHPEHWDHCGLPHMLTPAFESLLVVHPTGLAQPVADLILTWRADRIGRHPQFLMGSARSVARWCDKNRRSYDTVTVVPDALVSGTHVWANNGERLVEARWVR